MGKIFCVEFQRYPLKFHTKCLTHTLNHMIFIQIFKSSYIQELTSVFETPPINLLFFLPSDWHMFLVPSRCRSDSSLRFPRRQSPPTGRLTYKLSFPHYKVRNSLPLMVHLSRVGDHQTSPFGNFFFYENIQPH